MLCFITSSKEKKINYIIIIIYNVAMAAPWTLLRALSTRLAEVKRDAWAEEALVRQTLGVLHVMEEEETEAHREALLDAETLAVTLGTNLERLSNKFPTSRCKVSVAEHDVLQAIRHAEEALREAQAGGANDLTFKTLRRLAVLVDTAEEGLAKLYEHLPGRRRLRTVPAQGEARTHEQVMETDFQTLLQLEVRLRALQKRSNASSSFIHPAFLQASQIAQERLFQAEGLVGTAELVGRKSRASGVHQNNLSDMVSAAKEALSLAEEAISTAEVVWEGGRKKFKQQNFTARVVQHVAETKKRNRCWRRRAE